MDSLYGVYFTTPLYRGLSTASSCLKHTEAGLGSFRVFPATVCQSFCDVYGNGRGQALEKSSGVKAGLDIGS